VHVLWDEWAVSLMCGHHELESLPLESIRERPRARALGLEQDAFRVEREHGRVGAHLDRKADGVCVSGRPELSDLELEQLALTRVAELHGGRVSTVIDHGTIADPAAAQHSAVNAKGVGLRSSGAAVRSGISHGEALELQVHDLAGAGLLDAAVPTGVEGEVVDAQAREDRIEPDEDLERGIGLVAPGGLPDDDIVHVNVPVRCLAGAARLAPSNPQAGSDVRAVASSLDDAIRDHDGCPGWPPGLRPLRCFFGPTLICGGSLDGGWDEFFELRFNCVSSASTFASSSATRCSRNTAGTLRSRAATGSAQAPPRTSSASGAWLDLECEPSQPHF